MAPETTHVGDIGTTVYIDVLSNGLTLGASLAAFPTRTVQIRRPRSLPLLVITAVSTEVDSSDSVTKLKLVTGTDTGDALTGTGGFLLGADDVGRWLAQVLLADGTGSWQSDLFPLLDVERNLV